MIVRLAMIALLSGTLFGVALAAADLEYRGRLMPIPDALIHVNGDRMVLDEGQHVSLVELDGTSFLRRLDFKVDEKRDGEELNEAYWNSALSRYSDMTISIATVDFGWVAGQVASVKAKEDPKEAKRIYMLEIKDEKQKWLTVEDLSFVVDDQESIDSIRKILHQPLKPE